MYRYGVKQVFSEKTNFGIDNSFDVTKCLQPIERPDLFHMCTPCSELPSNNKYHGIDTDISYRAADRVNIFYL